MDIAYLKRTALGFLSVAVVICVFIYVIFHATGGFKPMITTTPALRGQYLERNDTQGYIFRYEAPLTADDSSTVKYNVSDGEKVALGASVATLYESGGDERVTERLVEIDRQIALLSRSNISDNVSVSDTKSEDERIASYLSTIIHSKREGNYSAVSNLSGDLLVSLNRRELIVSSRQNYDKEIAALRSERAQLSAGLSGNSSQVYMSHSGYFYYDCDGYENQFSPDLLDAITPSALDELASASADPVRYIGKCVFGSKWYLALKLERTELGKYTQGESYRIAFRDYSDVTVSMKLESVNVEVGEGVLVFSTSEMPDGFCYERSQNVSVISKEHDGLRFPAASLRLLDGVEGAYVLYGNTVFFRAAEVIARENGYVYVKDDTGEVVVSEGDEQGNGRIAWQGISLYDEVITVGTGLHHGMIVN